MKWFYGASYVLVVVVSSLLFKPQAALIYAIASLVLAYLLISMYKKRDRNRTDQSDKVDSNVQTQQLFQSLLTNSPNAIGLCNKEGQLMQVNPAAEQVLGISAEHLTGTSFLNYVANEQQEVTKASLLKASEGSTQTFETALLHKTGYRSDMKTRAVPVILNEQVHSFLLICEDSTDRKRADEQIRHLAFYDDMTGLPNRRLFREELNRKLIRNKQTQERLAVFYIDIDGFRLINEGFGFEFGNMLLLQLAERFSRCVGIDDFLARSEGDQFSIYYAHVRDSQHAIELADRIKHVLEQPFSLDDLELHITTSIGIVLQYADDEDAETLMKNANIALTRAKETEKSGVVVYNIEMQSYSLQRLKLESDLRRALAQEEFILHYQPQVDIDSGQIIGSEALIRWNHPERGLVSPGEFIPFAEETGLIVPIGEWALYEACRQNKEWQDKGFLHVPVSVNLSMRQFIQHNIKGKIAQTLQQTGLNPRFLELEITESMTMDVENAIVSLLELKKLGVTVAIDDFGTGYSSLHYLKKFPIDKLKIDRSFVRDIMEDPNDAAIVSTIIAMTRHLNLKVIAEGVETEEQLSFLHENHCDEVQGYWFSPPITAERMGFMLEQHIDSVISSEQEYKQGL
ncbi:EAL domain-containing protein [Paenibacillus sp. N1-5-1-14]|uniref:EAL domain-containing protein n=1 Tax=Paenibacillus radicibacter TaxID=2972488 RepID=UPI002158E56E|nr:EAL domain-containing protein [Paenibacillus radicibacter]MCR8643665.1 EAL domain-containing protein [Paenibacillus radicibacter]